MRSQRAVIFPLVSPPYGLKVVGRENLEGITGPVLFASNHNLGLDNPLIIKAVPLRWRRRMAVVGAADLWRNPVWWIMKPLLGNAFPLAREGSVRPSLAIMDNVTCCPSARILITKMSRRFKAIAFDFDTAKPMGAIQIRNGANGQLPPNL